MNRFSDILLTVDYDRTLTAPDSSIPQRNLDAIRYFIDNGGAFTVNTGRSLPQSGDILKNIPMNAPFLCYNGSLAVENGKPLFQYAIDLPIEQTLQSVCEAFPDLNVDLHGIHAHYGFQPVGCWDTYYRARNCAYHLAEPGTDYGPFVKFNVYGPVQNDSFYQFFSGTPEQIARIDAAEQWLRDTYGDRITVFRSGAQLLNIHAPGISKLRAARDLQKQLGRKLLVCVGDEDNDLPMLEGADHAFCPGDSPLAHRFPAVCPCADGAVADVIEYKLPEILNRPL